MRIEADFQRDLINLCREALKANGYTVNTVGRYKVKPTKEKPGKGFRPFKEHDYVLYLAVAEQRRIAAHARRIFRAKDFTCPAEHAAGLAVFLEKVEKGHSLVPHMSRSVMQVDEPDLLFNDWGIHHFHLGLEIQSDDLVTGTDNVLFALVTDAAVYCIAVLPHKDKEGPIWAKDQLIQTVHDNWPRFLRRTELKGAAPESATQTGSQDRLRSRKAGVNVFTQVSDGTVYAPAGGGIATSGDSVNAVQCAIRYRRSARDMERWVRANIPAIEDQLGRAGRRLPAKSRFHLEMDADKFYAVENSTGIRVLQQPR